MQKSFIRHIFTVSILSCCLLFGGCSQNSAGEETSSATTASPSPSETVAALPADVSPDSDHVHAGTIRNCFTGRTFSTGTSIHRMLAIHRSRKNFGNRGLPRQDGASSGHYRQLQRV